MPSSVPDSAHCPDFLFGEGTSLLISKGEAPYTDVSEKSGSSSVSKTLETENEAPKGLAPKGKIYVPFPVALITDNVPEDSTSENSESIVRGCLGGSCNS